MIGVSMMHTFDWMQRLVEFGFCNAVVYVRYQWERTFTYVYSVRQLWVGSCLLGKAYIAYIRVLIEGLL